MALSFWHLASSHPSSIAAGQSGFVAGAVLIGSGRLSLSLLVSREGRASAAENGPPDKPAGEESPRLARDIAQKW